MGRKIDINGVQFELEQKGVYVRFGGEGENDVMLSDRGEGSDMWDLYVHEKGTGKVLDHKDSQSRDFLVQWAQTKGYLPNN